MATSPENQGTQLTYRKHTGIVEDTKIARHSPMPGYLLLLKTVIGVTLLLAKIAALPTSLQGSLVIQNVIVIRREHQLPFLSTYSA